MTVLFCGWAQAEPSIVIRSVTELREARDIRLGDLADFARIDDQVRNKLAQIRVAKGIASGERMAITGSALSGILRAQPEWKWVQINKPVVKIPSRVTVTNVGGRPLQAELVSTIQSQFVGACSGCEVQIDDLQMPKIKNWPLGATWSIRSSSLMQKGAFTLPMDVVSADGNSQTYWLRGRVSFWREVPVSKRAMSLGERIQPEDVEWQRRDVTYASDGTPREEDLLGRKLRQGVAANQILFAGWLEKERALKRGDIVKMKVGDEGWEISMTGVAEQEGFIGDTVKLRNPQSGQLVVATVTGKGEVRIQ